MSDKVKSPIILLIVLIVVSLALAGGVFYMLQKERAKNVALQEELDDVKMKQKVTEAKLEESKKTISGLELKVQEAKLQIDKLTTDLQQEKAARQQAVVEIGQLKADLEQQKTLKADLEKKLSQAQKDTDKIQTQLKDLSSKKTDLEKKIKDLEAQAKAAQDQEGVELGKVVVTPETTTGVPVQAQASSKPAGEKQAAKVAGAPSEGKVLVINKEYNFAVIDLGAKDGIEIGNTFSIFHNNKYVGDVKVEKVHDSMAAAGFVNPEIKDKINEGDKVVRKK
jgi:septal ring factor EnvC (AmiA/AmiB activator)